MTPEIVLQQFRIHLIQEEKSDATVEKYLRDAGCFVRFLDSREITKELTLSYKKQLQQRYALRSVNSMLASVNRFLLFLGKGDCRVKNLRCQKMTYCAREQELTKGEYLRLLDAARGKESLQLILQTLCATGIRVSELGYFTVEGVRAGQISVRCKSKTRTILIPHKLRGQLLAYAARKGIRCGVLFRSRNGSPLNRSCIWRQMKALCAAAGVRGVYLDGKTGKYRARIKLRGVLHNLGTFSTLEAAVKARSNAEQEFFGAFWEKEEQGK